MIASVQEKFYPCFSDAPGVFSLQTACNEILKNVFTTERGFENNNNDESRYDDDDDDSCSACSIATDATPKTTNAPSPSSSSSKVMRKLQDMVSMSDAAEQHSETSSSSSSCLMFTAESAAELQYRCNKRAQRIQRAYERGLKSSKEDHARHLHERYGNRGAIIQLHHHHRHHHQGN